MGHTVCEFKRGGLRLGIEGMEQSLKVPVVAGVPAPDCRLAYRHPGGGLRRYLPLRPVHRMEVPLSSFRPTPARAGVACKRTGAVLLVF